MEYFYYSAITPVLVQPGSTQVLTLPPEFTVPQDGHEKNENNNTLKAKGYHLEHNFGHGKQHLSNLLISLNLLAFLIHTTQELISPAYQTLRQALGARKTFF